MDNDSNTQGFTFQNVAELLAWGTNGRKIFKPFFKDEKNQDKATLPLAALNVLLGVMVIGVVSVVVVDIHKISTRPPVQVYHF